MSNGFQTDPYSLESIGSSQILGAQRGGQNLQDIMKALYGTRRTAGYYGTTAASENQGLADLTGGEGNKYSFVVNPDTPYMDYSLEGVMGSMETKYGEGAGLTDPDDPQKGMQSLLELLKSIDIPGMQKEYGQDIGDVKSEIGAQMQGLQQVLTTGGKGARYSGIGTPRKNLGTGGRQQYMSDYYGLQQKQFEMERDMQKSLEDKFSSEVGSYMQLNPYVK